MRVRADARGWVKPMLRRSFALVACLALLVFAGGASARDSARRATPIAATFLITGHGWGHGIGMPQWGAYGYAQHGWTYQRILPHYFTGTTLGPAPVSKVRVLLLNGKKSVTLTSERPFKVRDAEGTVYPLAAGAYTLTPALKLKVDPNQPAQPLTGPITFLPGGTPLKLNHHYRGSLQFDVVGGRLRVIDVVGLEQYLYGVVPSEMPYTWLPEALKCQAIAARSYALAVRKTGAFDLYADTRSQVYAGVEAERTSTNAAVDATAGQVVLYGGKVATTYFFSSSGGRTASIQDVWANAKPVPYLVSVADPYDTISPHHSWGPLVFSAAKLAKVLKVPGSLVDVQAPLNSSGRVQEIDATGTRGEVSVPAADVRSRLGLDSTWFSLGQLSLSKPAKTSVAYGSRLRLDGVARGVAAPVLQQRASHGTWTSSGALAVAKDGTLSVVVKPAASTEYRLAVNGVAASGVVKIAVAPSVRLVAPTDQATLHGTLKPALGNTLVQIQRSDGTAWRTVATARSASDGTFAATLDLTAGTYRARVAPGHGYAVGLSPVLRIVGP